ncbi:MAG TPA: hypothetical protein VM008_10430 [Phycisphaerae bacterium]|nr:hypothetical protein [Phycisphaerae bacterium]
MGERVFFSLKTFVACSILTLLVRGVASAQSTAPAEGRLSFPTFGISFIPPAGWIANTCPTLPNIMMYRLQDRNQHTLGELNLEVSETPPFERHKLDEFALAQNAEVLVQAFQIDRAPAIAVRKSQRDDKSGAFLLLVADHENRSYTFSVQAEGDAAQTHDLITLVKSVRWIPFEDALDHVAASQKQSIFPNSTVDATIQLPLIFRRLPQVKQKNFDAFIVTDGASKQIAGISLFFIPADADHPGIPDDTQILDLRRNLLANAQKRWGMSDFPLMDTKSPIPRGVVTSPTVISSLSSDAHIITATSRYGAIFDKRGVTYIETQAFGDPSETTAKWDQLLLDIANSLTFTDQSATQPAGK